MSERTRKLHVVVRPRAGELAITVDVCRWDVAGAGERLLSSSDGIVAIETFAAHAAGAYWRIVDTLQLVAPWTFGLHKVARFAFYATSEPDVGAIHIVDARRPDAQWTHIRNRPDWLDVPGPSHVTYAVVPRAA